jgi:hypothetical protein
LTSPCTKPPAYAASSAEASLGRGADAIERDDVGAVEVADGPRLLQEALGALRLGLDGEDLQRDRPSNDGVPRQIDLAERALSQQPFDLKVPDPLPRLKAHAERVAFRLRRLPRDAAASGFVPGSRESDLGGGTKVGVTPL